MEVIKAAHSVYWLRYHVVWVTKYRRRVLKPGVCTYIRRLMAKLLRSMPGVEVITMGFDGDHLHMLMVIPPKYSISAVMGSLKGQTSSRLRKSYGWLRHVYREKNVFWSAGYFVSSVGIDEEIIQAYVEQQGRQDLGQIRMELKR
jgi:putative transposase